MASVGDIKYTASTKRINKEKNFKINFQAILVFYRTISCMRNFRLDLEENTYFMKFFSHWHIFNETLLTQPSPTPPNKSVMKLEYGQSIGAHRKYSLTTTKYDICFTLTFVYKVIPAIRPPDKSAFWKTIFFISHPKHMLWVLKRTVIYKQ